MTIKDVKLNFIIDNATELFLNKGINNVTIKDIALAIGIGEATIYRYFSKKHNIVLAVAIKLETDVYKNYFVFEKEKSGYDRLYSFYHSYLKIFKEHQNFYKFLSEFDSFVSTLDEVSLVDYEKGLAPFYESFIKSYNDGINDNTIKEVEDIDRFYYTTTHALLGLCKKLSVSDGLLDQDKLINSIDEIQTLVNIIMYNLKK